MHTVFKSISILVFLLPAILIGDVYGTSVPSLKTPVLTRKEIKGDNGEVVAACLVTEWDEKYGECKYYYPSKKLKSKITYPSYQYFESRKMNSNLKIEGHELLNITVIPPGFIHKYVNVLDRFIRGEEYYEEGGLKTELAYTYNRQKDYAFFFLESVISSVGNFQTEGFFSRGDYLGEFTEYNENGIVMRHGKCIAEGSRTLCEERYYYDHGLLKEERHYIDGKKEGEQISFFENKRVRERREFHEGVPVNKHSVYDEDGRLTIEVIFLDRSGRRCEGFKYNMNGEPTARVSCSYDQILGLRYIIDSTDGNI